MAVITMPQGTVEYHSIPNFSRRNWSTSGQPVPCALVGNLMTSRPLRERALLTVMGMLIVVKGNSWWTETRTSNVSLSFFEGLGKIDFDTV